MMSASDLALSPPNVVDAGDDSLSEFKWEPDVRVLILAAVAAALWALFFKFDHVWLYAALVGSGLGATALYYDFSVLRRLKMKFKDTLLSQWEEVNQICCSTSPPDDLCSHSLPWWRADWRILGLGLLALTLSEISFGAGIHALWPYAVLASSVALAAQYYDFVVLSGAFNSFHKATERIYRKQVRLVALLPRR